MPVYLPVVANTLALGMLVPTLPLYLAEEGLSLGQASVVLSGIGIGAALAGLPSGSLLARVSERAVVVGALFLTAVSTAAVGLTTSAIALLALRIATGAGNGAMRLSRQTYVTRRVEHAVRGRAMSLIGGSFRIGLLAGPLLGGALVDAVGFATTFAVAGALSLVGLIPTLRASDLPLREDAATARQSGLIEGLRRHWRLLLVAGVVPMLMMTVREGRFVVVPLIGDELGLTATEVGAVVTVGTAADALLFPVAGWLMDRFGRLYALVPAITLIALGLVLVGLADSAAMVVAGGAVIGIGNGMSSGTMLTLGSDLAPADAPGPFLAGIGAIQDGGRILGPLVVGLVGATADLGSAAVALALLCAVIIGWLVLVIGAFGEASWLLLNLLSFYDGKPTWCYSLFGYTVCSLS